MNNYFATFRNTYPILLFPPELDQPSQTQTDIQWIALAARVSDIVLYIANDNVFTTDVDFLSVLLISQETPAPLKSVIVALDTTRKIRPGDEIGIWKPIKEIPSKTHYQPYFIKSLQYMII